MCEMSIGHLFQVLYRYCTGTYTAILFLDCRSTQLESTYKEVFDRHMNYTRAVPLGLSGRQPCLPLGSTLLLLLIVCQEGSVMHAQIAADLLCTSG